MRIVVLGSGYVGLVTAAGLAELGHSVLCVDVDAVRVARLRQGLSPFFEPGLSEVVARNVRKSRLAFGTEIFGEHVHSQICFVAVGTPTAKDGSTDRSAVFAASRMAVASVDRAALLVIKSTVPVGTSEEVEAQIRPLSREPWRVVVNPEFLKEGAAVSDFFKPDRIVLGVDDARTEAVMREVYGPLRLPRERWVVMSRRSAELAKYAANAMLAARISFMNEMAQLCDRAGASIDSIRRVVGSDKRIGQEFLDVGPGYGGSCLPKDVSALMHLAREHGVPLEIVHAAASANEGQLAYVYEKLSSLFADGLRAKVVAVWGLAFKPETDDVREAPAGKLVQRLLRDGATVHAHDPEAAHNFARAYAPDARYFENEYDALDGADALVVITEWHHFLNPDFAAMKTRMAAPRIVDARNIWTGFKLDRLGFIYRALGAPTTPDCRGALPSE